MILTPEQKSSVDEWNALGSQINDDTFEASFPAWFSNIRSLLKSGISLQSLDALKVRLASPRCKTFTVIGSGPSALQVCERLPYRGSGAILCAPTALGALSRARVRPTALIVADANPIQYRYAVESGFYLSDIPVVLPTTADPSWYAKGSICQPKSLYFYKPYHTYMGDLNLGMNVILNALTPEVTNYAIQGGSVATVALAVADWLCGEDPDTQVNLAVDCSWPEGGPYRAPLALDVSKHSASLRDDWEGKNAGAAAITTARLDFHGETILSDVLNIGYGVQLLYVIYQLMSAGSFRDKRFTILGPSSKLFHAASPDVEFPSIAPEEAYEPKQFFQTFPDWPYHLILGLMKVSNALYDDTLRSQVRDRIRDHGKDKTPEELSALIAEKSPRISAEKILRFVREEMHENPCGK